MVVVVHAVTASTGTANGAPSCDYRTGRVRRLLTSRRRTETGWSLSTPHRQGKVATLITTSTLHRNQVSKHRDQRFSNDTAFRVPHKSGATGAAQSDRRNGTIAPVRPVQFQEPPTYSKSPERSGPSADQSTATMYQLRHPFEVDPLSSGENQNQRG